MGRFHQELEKAELHLHLEGSLEPGTLREIDPQLTPREIEQRYRYQNFDDFILSYKWVTSLLRTPEAYALAMRRLLERLAADNVCYAEITLSAGVALVRGLDFAPLYDAIAVEASRSNIEVWFILDAIRQLGPEHAFEVARLATHRASGRVVAFGIGGSEALGPAEWFADVFRFVKDHGLQVTVHAGETVGPESIWAALRAGADRIGHGFRAAEDAALSAYLRDHDVPLEICLSSNLALGLVPSLAAHPARSLFDAGVPIVPNTDDPAMFHTTLTREYELAERELGFSRDELRQLAANGFRYAFRRAGFRSCTSTRTESPAPSG
jgi:aminodeoxyfutalosine deaminase